MRLAALLMSVLTTFSATSGVRANGTGAPCREQLVAACWGDLASSVDCLLNPRSEHSQECTRLNATALCSVVQNSLRCSSKTVDDGCVLSTEREAFDFWMRGMEAAFSKLCVDGLLQNILSSAHCWDVLRFSHCVEHENESLQHVVDLLDVLDRLQRGQGQGQGHDAPGQNREGCHHECLRLMLTLSKCAGLGAALGAAMVGGGAGGCAQASPLDLTNELLAAYFSASECGGCSSPFPPRAVLEEVLVEHREDVDDNLGHDSVVTVTVGAASTEKPMEVLLATLAATLAMGLTTRLVMR